MSDEIIADVVEPIEIVEVVLQEASDGAPGTAGTITIGTVTTGAPGSAVSVVNVGTANAAILNISIPQGATGATGAAGTIAIGTVTTGAPGSAVSVTNVGTSSAAILNISIPAGATGTPGTPGTDANVTNANVNTAIAANAGLTRTALGLGNMAQQASNNVAITGGSAAFTGTFSVASNLIFDPSLHRLNIVGNVFRADLVFGNYSSVGSLLSGAGFFMGTGLRSSSTPNALEKTAGDAAHFFYTRYDKGISFHTGITGASGTIVPDTTNLRMIIDPAGQVGVNTNTPTCLFDISGNTMRLRVSRTPASATAAGNVGDYCWDANYEYRCVATNTWKRSPLSTW